MSLDSPAKKAKQPARPKVDRMLHTVSIMSIMGWSRTTLWRRIKAGAFPALLALGPNINGLPESIVLAERDKLPCRTYPHKDMTEQPPAAA